MHDTDATTITSRRANTAAVAACGATDCDPTSGACLYQPNSVAPASLQTAGDCEKVVCDGTGDTTKVDAPSNLPTVPPGSCITNPACCGASPMVACFTNLATGTACTDTANTSARVCGDTTNTAIAGTCV